MSRRDVQNVRVLPVLLGSRLFGVVGGRGADREGGVDALVGQVQGHAVGGVVDEVARGLAAEGVSVREVADLIGISPGRVSQVTRHSPCSA